VGNSQAWNLTVEQQLSTDVLLRVAYVGNKGTHLQSFRERNAAVYGPGATVANTNARRPLAPYYGSMRQLVDSGNSVYHSMQADLPKSGSTAGPLSRSYLTVRWQALRRLSLDLSHNYFRDLPTFDPRLTATGLLDKLLFQGLSAGARLDLPRNLSVYTNVGRSTRTGDARRSLNQLYGVTKGNLFGTGIRADARWATFDGSFGRGNYYSASLSRNLRQNFRAEVQTGWQNFASLLTTQTRSQFVTSLIDSSFGTHYFVQGGYTTLHGDAQSYDQWYFTMGYRFDTRGPR
jgi:hypothetical protein